MSALLMVPWLIIVTGGCPQQQPDKKGAPSKVKVTVIVILASERCTYIDRRLKDLAAEIRTVDPTLTGFSIYKQIEQSLAVDERLIIRCVETANVEIVIQQCVDKSNKVCLAVTPPMHDEIVYRCVCGKYLPIVTRYQTRPRVPPLYVAWAIGQLCGGSPYHFMAACGTLAEGQCRDRLVLAICVQPCTGK